MDGATMKHLLALIERALDDRIGTLTQDSPSALVDAMRYSLCAPSKRLRPLLALGSCEAVGGDAEPAIDVACAIEMVHTYSLIHDDLPAMDDDDFRRGKPSSHKQFGEALAILAGDALLTCAFELISGVQPPGLAAEIGRALGQAAGPRGMLGGQVADIAATGKTLDLAALTAIHRRKTGDLLVVSVRAGALIGGANPLESRALTQFGERLGLAFQIIDDLLDVSPDRATLGRPAGSDRKQGKHTFVDLLGADGARAHAEKVLGEAIDCLASLGERAQLLRLLADKVAKRAG